jgi:hypothetical protein
MTSFVLSDSTFVGNFVTFLRLVDECELALSLKQLYDSLEDTRTVLPEVERMFSWADEPFSIESYEEIKCIEWYAIATQDIISTALKREQEARDCFELQKVSMLLTF